MPGWLVIVNPAAGGGRAGGARMRALVDHLARDLGAELAATDGAGHAAALAAAAGDRAGLAVVGGDGTVAEAVEGMDRERQVLLVVAAGTGNGLARDLGLARPADALEAVRRGPRRRIDLFRATFLDPSGWHGRLVVSTAGVGFAAEAAARAGRRHKRLGPAAYPLAAARQAFAQRPFDVAVRLDGEPPRRLALTNAMVNSTRHAGNFAAFPGTDPADGRLRVLLARAGPAAQLAHAASVLTRTYAYRSGRENEVRAVSLHLTRPATLMLDGELRSGVTAVRFDVLPGALARAIALPRGGGAW